MPQITQEPRLPALASTTGGSSGNGSRRRTPSAQTEPGVRGFGSTAGRRERRNKSGRKRSPALSKGDWGPLGKHPDLEAIVARQRLGLPLSGRLSAAVVNQAWKRCAAAHHPDRGGHHETMQLVNGARDLLLERHQPAAAGRQSHSQS